MAQNYPTFTTGLDRLHQARSAGLADAQTAASTQQTLANAEMIQANAELQRSNNEVAFLENQYKQQPEYQQAWQQAQMYDLQADAAKNKQSISAAEMQEMQQQIDIANAIRQAKRSGDARQLQQLAASLETMPQIQQVLQDPNEPLAQYVQAYLANDSNAEAQANLQLDLMQAVISAPAERAGAASRASTQFEANVEANKQIRVKQAEQEAMRQRELAVEKAKGVGGKPSIPVRPTDEERAFISQAMFPDDWFGLNKTEKQQVETTAMKAKALQETAKVAGQVLPFDEAVQQVIGTAPVLMVAPDGGTYQVDQSEVEAAQQNGWKIGGK